MIDGDTLAVLQRIAVALERLADHFAAAGGPRKPKPAILSTATYSHQERERQELRAALRGEKPKPQGGTPATVAHRP